MHIGLVQEEKGDIQQHPDEGGNSLTRLEITGLGDGSDISLLYAVKVESKTISLLF